VHATCALLHAVNIHNKRVCCDPFCIGRAWNKPLAAGSRPGQRMLLQHHTATHHRTHTSAHHTTPGTPLHQAQTTTLFTTRSVCSPDTLSNGWVTTCCSQALLQGSK
jgi:hypothetical protein